MLLTGINCLTRLAATALISVAILAGCSNNARIFREARVGMSAAKVRGLEHYQKGGIFLGNDRKLVASYPGNPDDMPEGICYAIVVAESGTIVAKGYLDLEGQDRFCVVIQAAHLQELQQVQERVGAPDSFSNAIINSTDHPSEPQPRFPSGVAFEDWAVFSDCLMGWPFARRSNDLRCHAAHGGEIPWDLFVSECRDGTLNKGCDSDVVGIRGRSPSRHIVGGYIRVMGLRIGGGSTRTDRPSEWKE